MCKILWDAKIQGVMLIEVELELAVLQRSGVSSYCCQRSALPLW